jgi:hypothetical protein
MEQDNVLDKFIFSDISTFHLSGKVNSHIVHMCGTERQRAVVEHQRHSPKVNVFCAISISQVYRPFSFMEPTVTRTSYLDMLHCTVPQLLQDDNNDLSQFTFHQDSAPRIKSWKWDHFSMMFPQRDARNAPGYQLASSFTRHYNPWFPFIGLRQGFNSQITIYNSTKFTILFPNVLYYNILLVNPTYCNIKPLKTI